MSTLLVVRVGVLSRNLEEQQETQAAIVFLAEVVVLAVMDKREACREQIVAAAVQVQAHLALGLWVVVVLRVDMLEN
jgi:hypothetical protein